MREINIRIDFVFTFILSTIFIVLKLLGKISWSWWWVLSPIWITIILSLILILVYIIITRRSRI